MSSRAILRWRRLKNLCLLLPAIVLAGDVSAQPASYPDKSVRIISDAAPGGAIDTNLRIIAEGLSRKWGQQVVIDNRPGAGGAISATAAAEATPDGYTIYAPALSVFLTIPGKAPNLPLELPRDFTAIGITAVQPMSIGINPKLGINSLPELIAQAKKEPGSISYAVTGVGRLTHLTGELLQIRGNIKLQMVPYTGGSAQSLADVTAGRVALVIEGYAGLAGAYESGQLEALAVASEKRLPHVPDLPTVAETLPGFVAVGWQCVVAPVGTPDAIVRKISDDLRAVLIASEIEDKLAARGAYVHPVSPSEAQTFVHSQQELWRPALERMTLEFKEK
jgi:tripartite-type tricarboxylate transporter receptor subunit TctC